MYRHVFELICDVFIHKHPFTTIVTCFLTQETRARAKIQKNNAWREF